MWGALARQASIAWTSLVELTNKFEERNLRKKMKIADKK